MNERTPGKPVDKPDEDETAPAEPSATDPPASAVRPSLAHPMAPTADPANDDGGDPEATDVARRDGDGGTARKRRKRLNLQAKDANDIHAPPPDLATRLARLAKRDWHGKIIGWHIKTFRLPEWEIEDIFQDACVSALDEDDWPAEEKPTLSWLFKITRNTCYDHLRAQKRRRDREVPLDDLDVSAETQERDEGKDLKDFIEVTSLEKPQIASGIAMLVEHRVLGEDVKDIAVKHAIPVRLVYERMGSARAVIRSGYPIGGGLVAAIAFLLLLIRFPGDDGRGVGAGHDQLPDGGISSIPLPPTPDPAELRTRALELCHERRYEPCLEGLNRARRIDPAGEKDPKVIQARQEAEGKLRE